MERGVNLRHWRHLNPCTVDLKMALKRSNKLLRQEDINTNAIGKEKEETIFEEGKF